jgi:hypothetical protein
MQQMQHCVVQHCPSIRHQVIIVIIIIIILHQARASTPSASTAASSNVHSEIQIPQLLIYLQLLQVDTDCTKNTQNGSV